MTGEEVCDGKGRKKKEGGWRGESLRWEREEGEGRRMGEMGRKFEVGKKGRRMEERDR